MINEAIFAVMEGVGTPEAIDTVMKLGMNHPMGPLTLADFIGLDVCLAILNVLHEGLGDPNTGPARCCDGWSRPVILDGRADTGFTPTDVVGMRPPTPACLSAARPRSRFAAKAGNGRPAPCV